MGRISEWGTNKKQFMLERITTGVSIVPALVVAFAPDASLARRVAIFAIVGLYILYSYMAIYRAYIKKDWYKCKMIFPGSLALLGVLGWVLLPIPPDVYAKLEWVPFLLAQYLIFAAIVDYRVYFGPKARAGDASA